MTKPTPEIDPATFIIKDHSDITKVISFLHNNYTKVDKPLVVRINQKQESLTDAQRRLYWLWMTQYGNQRGMTKDEAAAFFKYKYLSIIYERDNVGEYPNTFKAVKRLKTVKHPDYEVVRQFVADKISIKVANTKQMAEFLNDIELFCIKDGVKLVCPGDLMYLREMQ